MTFSLVARCSITGMFGIAISSSSPAVASRCAYTRSGVGAVASQNVTDPTLGPKTLDYIQKGLSAKQAVEEVKNNTQFLEYRQILAIDKNGKTANHSGVKSLGIWADCRGKNVISAGNLLANKNIPKKIVDVFENKTGHLGDRLISALKSGLKAGGEAGQLHSAGLQICDDVSWPIVDLRCDWTEYCPIEAISNAWTIYKPQIQDYVLRALNPHKAPSYDVPGDDN